MHKLVHSNYLDATNWGCEGRFRRPTPTKPLIDAGIADLKMATQHSNAASYAIDRVIAVVAPVLGLLKSCPPTAITRFVVAVVVRPSVNLKTLWAFSHVAQERLKGVLPAFANRNSTSSVVGEIDNVGITTSLDKRSPFGVGTRQFPASSVPMLKATLGDGFNGKTATRLGMAALEVDVKCDNAGSAVALTAASGVSMPVWGKVGVNQYPCEPLPNERFAFHGSVPRRDVFSNAFGQLPRNSGSHVVTQPLFVGLFNGSAKGLNNVTQHVVKNLRRGLTGVKATGTNQVINGFVDLCRKGLRASLDFGKFAFRHSGGRSSLLFSSGHPAITGAHCDFAFQPLPVNNNP